MDKNRLNTSHLLQKKEAEAIDLDAEYCGKTLLSYTDQIKHKSFVLPISTKDLYMNISESNISEHIDFIQKIGLTPESEYESLCSFLPRLEETPFLATYIVKEIIGKHISGDEETFVRLIDSLLRHEKYIEAYELCRYAEIEMHGRSLDIYTRCLEVSPYVPGNEPRKYAFSVIRDFASSNVMKSWMNERMYVAICNFYFKAIADSPWEEKTNLLEEGIRWAHELIEYEKTNENGYYWEVTFLLQGNRRKEAENRLRCCIYDPPDPRRDSFARLRCPKCCALYYELFLRYKGSYNQCKEILTKGREDSRMLNLKGKIWFFEEELQNLNDAQDVTNKLIFERKITNGQ